MKMAYGGVVRVSGLLGLLVFRIEVKDLENALKLPSSVEAGVPKGRSDEY